MVPNIELVINDVYNQLGKTWKYIEIIWKSYIYIFNVYIYSVCVCSVVAFCPEW